MGHSIKCRNGSGEGSDWECTIFIDIIMSQHARFLHGGASRCVWFSDELETAVTLDPYDRQWFLSGKTFDLCATCHPEGQRVALSNEADSLHFRTGLESLSGPSFWE